MKKPFVILFRLSFCLSIFYSNQTFGQGKLQLGPIFGIGISNMHGNYEEDFRPHAHMGILANYKIKDKLNLQPAVLVTTKGYAEHINKEVTKLNYCDLIVTMKYHLYKVLFVGAGFQAGWLLSAHYKFLDHGTDYYDKINIASAVNKVDYGLNASLGCQFKNGVGVEISVLYGIRDVYNSSSTEPIEGHYDRPVPIYIPQNVKGKNTIISTSFYALFGKKKKEAIE